MCGNAEKRVRGRDANGKPYSKGPCSVKPISCVQVKWPHFSLETPGELAIRRAFLLYELEREQFHVLEVDL